MRSVDPLGAPEPVRRSRRTTRRRRAATQPVRRQQMPLWQELPLLLLVAFCLAVLIRTFLVQAFFIPSGSMQDTLLVGDRVLVNKVVYDVRDPLRGEVVVFRGTDAWAPEYVEEGPLTFGGKLSRTLGDLVGVSRPGEKDFIKRVIGLPGDRIACCDAQGRLQVNGEPVNESYISVDSPLDAPPGNGECRSRRFAEVTVPAGQLFVMGDHRLVSQDSRCQGPVPIDNVIGRAFVIVWPNDRWANLSVPDPWQQQPAAAGPDAQLSPELGPVPGPPAGAPAPAAPTGPDALGGIVILVPALLYSGLSARSRRCSTAEPRRLRP